MLPPSIYKLRSGQRGTSGSLPAGLNTLGLSWLNQRLEAVAVNRGTVAATWRSPQPVEDGQALAAAVKEAVAATGYPGGNARLVLAHPRQMMQLSEVPSNPGSKGNTWNRLLERLAQREKAFDGPAAWSFEPTQPSKRAANVLLHLWPKALLEATTRACKQAGVDLVQVTPASAVLHGVLPSLPLGADEVALLLAEVEGTALLVAGRREGPLLLARWLPSSWNGNLPNFAVDLNRTLLFLNEQFGVNVGSIHLLGSGAQESLEPLQAQTHVPVQLCPCEVIPGFWATRVLSLPDEFAPNLISVEQREAPKRKRLLTLTSVVLALLCLGTVGTVAWSEMVARHTRQDIVSLKKRHRALTAQHQALQNRFAELTFQHQVSQAILAERPAPVPAWFLGYLSEVFPERLLLQAVRVSQQPDGLWHARLDLALQPIYAASALSAALTTLTNRLGEAPLYMTPVAAHHNTHSATAARASVGQELSAWAQKFQLHPRRAQAKPRTYTLEGIMQ